MNGIKNILVVSRMTQPGRKAIRYGISIAKKYGASLHVLHSLYNPFGEKGWSVGDLSLQEEYQKLLQDAQEQLPAIIEEENVLGRPVEELIREGEPTAEILKAVREKNIDLLILQTHEEGRMEHFLFGRTNEELIKKMPCPIMLVKEELPLPGGTESAE
jgi:universal stress protein A